MISFFLACQLDKTVFLVSSFMITAPFSFTVKPFGLTILLLTSDITNRSAKTDRNSSIKSKAKDILPGLSLCRKPTYGSSPTACNADAHSFASNVYVKESVFCKRNFLTFAKIFPQAPVGKFYVNPSNFSSKISYV